VDGGKSTTEEKGSYGALAREVGELREENTRLRGLLGLEHRPADGHETECAPTLLAVPPERVTIDASATDAEKLTLLRPLFGTRSDVFGLLRPRIRRPRRAGQSLGGQA
jgi:hypothetical protein